MVLQLTTTIMVIWISLLLKSGLSNRIYIASTYAMQPVTSFWYLQIGSGRVFLIRHILCNIATEDRKIASNEATIN